MDLERNVLTSSFRLNIQSVGKKQTNKKDMHTQNHAIPN